MVQSDGYDELSGSELLDRVELLGRTQRRTEVEILRAALAHAILHNGDTIDPARAALPGREQARRLGGQGTPTVAEFAPAELGARLGLSPYAGRSLIADALDLRHRLPQLWRRVQALEVRASYARFVARRTRDLAPEQAATVDARVAAYADGSVSWTRFENLLEAAVKAADPVAAAAAEDAAAQWQFAEPTRSEEHGLGGFYVRATAAIIARFDATVSYLAQALADLGDNDTRDQRRVKAILILANPEQAVDLLRSYAQWRRRSPTPQNPAKPSPPDPCRLLPAVVIFVHIYPERDGAGIARVEGLGPMTEQWVRDHLSPHAKVRVQPVLDLQGQAPVDAYEIPDRHRQAVHLLTPADTFPYASSTSRSMQIDHTIPWTPGAERPSQGASGIGNYGPMSTPHHRLKTFGHWQVKQPFPGVYIWRDPYGAMYLVDHTGTHPIQRRDAA